MQIKISEILQIKNRLREINMLDLQEIEFIDNDGTVIQIDKKIIEDWRFTGLNNCDFIDSGFYITGFDQ